MFLSIIEGMNEGAQIIFFIFVVGASLHIIVKTGAMDAGIASMVRLTEKRPSLSNTCIALTMIVVSAWASTGTLSYSIRLRHNCWNCNISNSSGGRFFISNY